MKAQSLLTSLLVWGVVVCHSSATALAETAPIPISAQWLNDLVEEARTNNPGQIAATHRIKASQANNDSIRTWDDPMFRVGGVISAAKKGGGHGMPASSGGPNLEEEGDLIYGAEQKLPLFGKAKLMRRVALAETKTTEAERDYQFQLLRRDLAQGVYDLALAQESLRLSATDVALLSKLTSLATDRYQTRTGSQIETLRIQAELAKRTNQIETERKQIAQIERALNRSLNRPLDHSWPQLSMPSLVPPMDQSSKFIAFAEKFEPKLKVLRANAHQTEEQANATRRQRLPDVTVGVEGRQFSGDAGFREGMFFVGLNLPWFNQGKYKADWKREKERAEAQRMEVVDYALAVRQELQRVLTIVDAARREALVYQDEIIPKTTQALDAAVAAWTTNQSPFSELMELRRAINEARIMFARAVIEQNRMIAELITCCGLADLDSLNTLSNP